jgi:hypothetical protein
MRKHNALTLLLSVARARSSQLPAAPFVALIENNKCKCLPPQVCDE